MTRDPLTVAIDALAVHRITRLITDDDERVPFGPVRDRILAKTPNSMLGQLITCPWCMGMWISAAVVAARTLLPSRWSPAATALAFSSITGLLSTWEQK